MQIDRTFTSAREAWRKVMRGGQPDLVMAVLPTHIMAQFIRLAGKTRSSAPTR